MDEQGDRTPSHMPRRTPISLCMIVKDEAERLPQCLESVRPLVSELIVVDTGSTDETVAIAQSFGAKTYDFPWNHNFSDARNESLKYATGDWVLVLDADEVLTPSVIPLIQQAVEKPDYLAINLLRHEVGATQSPYSLVSRLFRRHPEICFQRPYHAMIDDSVADLLQREPHWQIGELPQVAILHYGYEPGAIATRDKYEKARTTMEGFFAVHPDDPYVCSKLGALYVQMGKIEQGMALLERGLAAPQADAPVRYELHYHLGIAHARLNHTEEARQHYQAAIQQPILGRLKIGAYNNLGNLLKSMGDLPGAKRVYQQCITIASDFAIGHNNLGMTLKAMGELSAAIAHYQQAIALNPSYAEAYQNLGVALLKAGQVPQSLEAFERAIALHSEANPEEAKRLRRGLLEMGFVV